MLGLLAGWLGFERPMPGWVRAKSGDACLFVASMDDQLGMNLNPIPNKKCGQGHHIRTTWGS